MKKMTGKVSVKRQNYLSFMFVPHRKGSVHTIRINNYRTTLLSATAIMLVALLMLTGYTLSVVRQNQEIKALHTQELNQILNQKNKLEDILADQTEKLTESSELITAAATAQNVTDNAIDQYKEEYEDLVVSYVDKNIQTIKKVSRGASKEATFKESLTELRNLIDIVQNAKLSEDDISSQIAKKETELTNYLDSLPTYWPIDNYTRIDSPYGRRLHPIYNRYITHDGIDIGETKGSAIYAAGAGKVVLAGINGGYGKCVIIDHGNGLKSLYGHLSAYSVKEGDWVKKGQKIAAMGNTGNSTSAHLHFEVRISDSPTDPTKYLEKR